MNLLEVKNICKTYGNGETAVKALKDVSFSVPKGEYVAIVGESGSGKSTLLNMIGALDTPTSGKVLIDGKDIFSMNDKKLTVFRRRNIGFIFQAFNLVPELTVEQNIIFPVLLDYQKPDKKYLEELLTVLNLKERRNHLPSQLSGGQQQRGQCVLHLTSGISQRRSQIALRVVVDEKHALVFSLQRRGEIQSSRCFPNAAFLVGDCQNGMH